jgi:hypothetical protein
MSILLASTPTCKQGYYWNGSACVPLHNFGTPTPYTAPLDASRRAAAVATLTTPPKDKPTPPTKVVASPASSTAVAPSFLLTRPEFSLEKNLQTRQNLVAELVSSGDAARVLAPQLADPKNTKSVFELTQAALSSDPEFLQKIAAHKTAEFVKNEQAAYTTTNPVQKGANFVSALLSDPILTGANLMQGKRPLLGQAAVLRDPAHPAHNLVSTLSGANTNWLNDLVNSVNPASYATSAGVSANKNNYAQAGVDLGSAFLGGTDLQGLQAVPELLKEAGRYFTAKKLPGFGVTSPVDNVLPPPPNQIFLNIIRSPKPRRNIYKKTDVVKENGFNIRTTYRGNKEIPKEITVEGKSGYWQLKPNMDAGDNTWYFSAAMDNQLESGKAMLKINEKFPFPKPSILEPNNLSLDSYNNLLNMGKRKDWFMQFENYIPLNYSAKHNTLLKELNLPNTRNTSIFKSGAEAQQALEKVNEFLSKKGINEKAKIYSMGDSFGIEIPNFRLTRNYTNGGILIKN